MVNWQLEQQALHAVHEEISKYTVVIDVSDHKSPSWGTGTLVRFQDRHFILTCCHVVPKNYPDEDIGVLFHPPGTLKVSSKEKIKASSVIELKAQGLAQSFRKNVKIVNRIYPSSPELDLMLLELNNCSDEVRNNHFYDLVRDGIKSPQLDQQIFLSGFSEELVKTLPKRKFGVLPYFLDTVLSEKLVDGSDYDSETQFLIQFTIDKESVEPRGLSGCGVWVRLPSGKDNIWTPNIYLVGVQRSVYRKTQVLAVTKAQSILTMIAGCKC